MTQSNKNIVITEATSKLAYIKYLPNNTLLLAGSAVLMKSLHRIRDLITIDNYRQNYFCMLT